MIFNTAKFIFNILVNDKHVEHTLISKLSLAQLSLSSLNIMLVHVIWDTSKWFYPHYWWNHSSCFTFLHILKSITVNAIIRSIQSTFTRGQSQHYTSHNVLDGVTVEVHELIMICDIITSGNKNVWSWILGTWLISR